MKQILPVQFEVQRYSPEQDSEPRSQTFTVDVTPGMTVLSGLLAIKEQMDSTLTWRFSCRMGVCGSCGMVINGRPGLACNTQILDISRSRITLAPLANFPIARDLVVNTTQMFDKHRALKPYIVHRQDKGTKVPDGEYEQSPDELLNYLQFADCIKCGACMSACPTLASDSTFPGPMPLTAAQRYNADTRDAGFAERKAALSGFHDLAHCHYAAECSRVCPKGVDPARAIQLLKQDMVKDALFLRAPDKVTNIIEPGKPGRGADIPEAPPFTVDR